VIVSGQFALDDTRMDAGDADIAFSCRNPSEIARTAYFVAQ
jgi:hypothetical protein